MVERKRRKKNKQRGERTQGKGDTKNNRGAGCRGGRGRAGSTKGKFASLGRLDKRKYKLKPKTKEPTITIGKLDEKIEAMKEQGKVKEENGFYIVDKESGYNKILGQGETNKKLIVRINATKQAIEKILNAKGKFEFEKKNYEKEEELEFEEKEE